MIALALPGPLHEQFFQFALLAGTAVAVVVGATGFFAVSRNEIFAGDALGHLAFTGGLAALAYGMDARLGVYLLPVAFAVPLGLLGSRRGRERDVQTGIVFALILGVGAYFLSVFANGSASAAGPGAVRVLFGSVFGLDAGRTLVTVVVAAVVCLALALMARPLLAVSMDPVVSRARGLPVRRLDVGFLMLVGVAVAQGVQVVGALLLLGLLAAPAATAVRLVARPWHALALTVAIACGDVWVGLALSRLWPSLPPSFAIVAVAFAGLLASVGRARRRGSLVAG